MSFFTDFINLWRSDDLLSQAWNESNEMLKLSLEMFEEALKLLHEDTNVEKIKALKKRDVEINRYQMDVRRKVMTHYSVDPNRTDLASGMVLVNMVVDIERLGDYTKNILDLASYYPKIFKTDEISEKLALIESEILSRFYMTVKAIELQETEMANKMHATYKNLVNNASDKLVNSILTGETKFGDETLTATVALYARYLKRVGAHLKNITSILVNPFDLIGYKIDEK